MSNFNLEDFIENPSAEKLDSDQIRKVDWINLAKTYEISYKQQWRKAKIKNAVLESLVKLEIVDYEAMKLLEDIPEEVNSEVRKLELEFERDKLRFEQERLKLELEDREKEREEKEKEREEKEKEKEREEKEKERKHQYDSKDRFYWKSSSK